MELEADLLQKNVEGVTHRSMISLPFLVADDVLWTGQTSNSRGQPSLGLSTLAEMKKIS